MRSRSACRRGASVQMRTWRVLRSISPRAPETMWSARPSQSTAGLSMRTRGSRETGGISYDTSNAVIPGCANRTRVYPSSAMLLSKSATADLDAQARNDDLVATTSRLDLHILEIARLVVDADLGR